MDGWIVMCDECELKVEKEPRITKKMQRIGWKRKSFGGCLGG